MDARQIYFMISTTPSARTTIGLTLISSHGSNFNPRPPQRRQDWSDEFVKLMHFTLARGDRFMADTVIYLIKFQSTPSAGGDRFGGGPLIPQ